MIIGIDPGLTKGAISVVVDGKITRQYCMPKDGVAIYDLLYNIQDHSLEDISIYIEEQHPRPARVFKPGKGWEMLVSLKSIASHMRHYEDIVLSSRLLVGDDFTFVVPPQVWKKKLKVSANKQTSIDKAKELFTGISLRRTKRCTKDDDGLAESALIAYYGLLEEE